MVVLCTFLDCTSNPQGPAEKLCVTPEAVPDVAGLFLHAVTSRGSVFDPKLALVGSVAMVTVQLVAWLPDKENEPEPEVDHSVGHEGQGSVADILMLCGVENVQDGEGCTSETEAGILMVSVSDCA